jgi:sRNA-binding regulator protein Hfq
VDENVYDGVKREEEVAYRVRVLTSGGNEQLSVERMLDFNAHKMIVQVYPNPATDKVGVDMTATVTDNDAFLEVYGRDGRLVYRHAIESGSVREQIDLAKANIESGSYTVHLVTGDQILDAQPLHVMR